MTKDRNAQLPEGHPDASPAAVHTGVTVHPPVGKLPPGVPAEATFVDSAAEDPNPAPLAFFLVDMPDGTHVVFTDREDAEKHAAEHGVDTIIVGMTADEYAEYARSEDSASTEGAQDATE